MPIRVPQKPSQARTTAIDANRRGLSLHARGEIAGAISAFRSGLAEQPELPELHVNLACSLAQADSSEEALHEYDAALALDRDCIAALLGKAALLVRLGHFEQARPAYEQALQIDPDQMQAHLAMYELEQISGETRKALEHQARVLEQRTLFTERAPAQERRLLVLMAPGDWQANVPIDFLIDRNRTTLHKLYLVSPESARHAPIPDADAVFTGIAQSDENAQALALAQEIVERSALPAINRPEHIARTERTEIWRKLHALTDVVVPKTLRLRRSELLRGVMDVLAFPMLLRPVGSQAGLNLERVESRAQIVEYLERVPDSAFFATAFVDFSKEDGYFRKYRIIVVDGVPYAYHLAISPRWMIHYYNAPMRDNAWMRDEEEHFLSDFESVFDPALQRALRAIADELELEYFGIDCSIDRQGRLLLFEADPAMIVHAGDDPALFAYKIPAARRIFAAFEQLIDRARSR